VLPVALLVGGGWLAAAARHRGELEVAMEVTGEEEKKYYLLSLSWQI